MRLIKIVFSLLLYFWLTCLHVFAQAGREAENYPLHPDSQRKDGVPQGRLIKGVFAESKVYPGTTRDYWVYVPSQYTGEEPACLVVFQDGRGAWPDKKSIRAPIVFDNLIHAGDMPVTIAVFINPGIIPAVDPETSVSQNNRQLEYDAVSGDYADFLMDELLPAALEGLNVSDRPTDRAVAGGSSGGIAAFNVAWQRPDAFSRVLCWVGTFVGLRGGNELAALVRKTEPKPLRVFLQDGRNDLNTYNGSWWVANQGMLSALEFSGYEVEHVWGDGYHGGKHAGAIMPDGMRWLWKTWPEAPRTHYEKSAHQDLNDVLIEGKGWELMLEAGGAIEDVALAPDGSLFYSVAEASCIYRIGPESGASSELWLTQSGGATGLAFDKEGRLYGCQEKAGKVARWDVVSKKVDTLAKNVRAKAIVLAHDGTAYFTVPESKAVWCIPPERKQRPFIAADDYSGVHGITLSPDQSFVYVSDSSGRHVWSAQRASDGSLRHNRAFYHLNLPPASVDIRSQAKGMRVDRSGWLLVASAMGAQLLEPRGMVHLLLPPPHGTDGLDALCFGPNGQSVIAACGNRIYSRPTLLKAARPYAEPAKPIVRKW